MTTWTTQSKNTSTFSNQSKNTSTFTPLSKTYEGSVTATAGLYYGFGSFNFAGGEILVAGTLPVYTLQNKS